MQPPGAGERGARGGRGRQKARPRPGSPQPQHHRACRRQGPGRGAARRGTLLRASRGRQGRGETPPGTQAPSTPTPQPRPNLKALPGLRWGGAWANNSPCDFTDRRLGQERFHPQGDTEPLVWDQQRTRRAQTPPQTFLKPSPTSENHLSRHHQQQQGPPPPPALPYRAPQRHGDPQAGLSLSNPGPLAPGSGSVFLARVPPHTHTLP